MPRTVTITLDEDLYQGLERRVGLQHADRFVGDLLRLHLVDKPLEEGYRLMAADEDREAEAQEWCHGLSGDLPDEAR